MSFLYLTALLVSLGGMVALDARFRLFFWRSPVRAAVVLACGVGFFALWDVAGIALGLFRRGDATISTGILVGPEFPLEELVFLALLCYLAMNLVGGFDRIIRRPLRSADDRIARSSR